MKTVKKKNAILRAFVDHGLGEMMDVQQALTISGLGIHIHEAQALCEVLLEDDRLIWVKTKVKGVEQTSKIYFRAKPGSDDFLNHGGYINLQRKQRFGNIKSGIAIIITIIFSLASLWISWRAAVAAERAVVMAEEIDSLLIRVERLETRFTFIPMAVDTIPSNKPRTATFSVDTARK